jgi:hypothetical protein
MPIQKARLSRSEQAEDRQCLREMYHEGVVDISDDSLDDAPALDISVIGGLETLIFNLPSGLAGYAITVRLVARKSGLILMEPEISTQHDRQIELESFDLGGPVCELGQCWYRKSEVLNDRFPLKFKRRGSMVEAVILATGLKPIPARYLQGMIMPFTLTFWDQFAIPIGIEEGLSVDRSTTPRQRRVRPERSLLAPEEILESREPIGGDNPNTQTPLRSAPGTKTR